MSTIVTRSGKGSPLTHVEVDANFTNLNSDKTENATAAITGGTINGATVGATTPAAGTFTTLTATGTSSFGTGSAAYWSAIGGSAPNLRSTAGGTIDIGGSNNLSIRTNTTAEQLRVSHTASAVNYVQVTGAATGGSPTISAQGSDSNPNITLQSKGTGNVVLMDGGGNTGVRLLRAVASGDTFVDVQRLVGGVSFTAASSVTNGALVFQSKGTGAIDLAAGSSGVNISNGGTVTAITRTATGGSYTSIPSVAITAPTTAGGVQATATATMFAASATVQSGGTGYTVNDVLTVVGGTFSSAATFTVSAVSAGVVTAVTLTSGGTAYSVLPTNPVSTTGGTGTGATLNITGYGLSTTFTITNAGSGYVEQPTVTFSGGGGSGAAAYASVGAATTIKTLFGTTTSGLDLATPAGAQVRIADIGDGTRPLQLNGGSASATQIAGLFMNTSGASLGYSTNTGTHAFYTGGRAATEQMRVSHTASAVNYVQVTGAATGSYPIMSSQGSDSTVGLGFQSKSASILFFTRTGVQRSFNILDSASTANYLQVQGAATTVAPTLSSQGTDTNIDLTLTPKGTGNVRFGTYTANMALTIQGYIEIKDSGGTTRRLAVIA